METFAVTVQWVGKTEPCEEDYKKIFAHWEKNKVHIVEMVSEIGDESKKLHYHGLLEISRGVYRKKLHLKNFHVKLESIYNREGWQRYINKNKMIKMRNMFQTVIRPESPDIMSDQDYPDEELVKVSKRILPKY